MRSFKMLNYEAQPLPKPESLACFYFRNKNRLLHGELSPYFSLPGDANTIENVEHWKNWEMNMPNMHIIDLDSMNHLTLLSQKKTYETIFEFCSILYSRNGISKEALHSFKERTKGKHGILLEGNQT